MVEAKEVDKKDKEEERKSLILMIVETVLFSIPIIGQTIGSLGKIGTIIARFVLLGKTPRHRRPIRLLDRLGPGNDRASHPRDANGRYRQEDRRVLQRQS